MVEQGGTGAVGVLRQPVSPAPRRNKKAVEASLQQPNRTNIQIPSARGRPECNFSFLSFLFWFCKPNLRSTRCHSKLLQTHLTLYIRQSKLVSFQIKFKVNPTKFRCNNKIWRLERQNPAGFFAN